jgi:hypothetical protein
VTKATALSALSCTCEARAARADTASRSCAASSFRLEKHLVRGAFASEAPTSSSTRLMSSEELEMQSSAISACGWTSNDGGRRAEDELRSPAGYELNGVHFSYA